MRLKLHTVYALSGIIIVFILLVCTCSVTPSDNTVDNSHSYSSSQIVSFTVPSHIDVSVPSLDLSGFEITLSSEVTSSLDNYNQYYSFPNYSIPEDAYYVFVTEYGTKYHMASCSYLTKSSKAMEIHDARANGFTSCSRCDPLTKYLIYTDSLK